MVLCAVRYFTAEALAGAANFVCFSFVSKGSGKYLRRYRLSGTRTSKMLAEFDAVKGSSKKQHSLLKNTVCFFANCLMLTRFCVNTGADKAVAWIRSAVFLACICL